jgi:hypothetical protein
VDPHGAWHLQLQLGFQAAVKNYARRHDPLQSTPENSQNLA